MSELLLEKNNELPKTWGRCKVGDICDVLGGKRLPKGHTYSENETNFPYVRVVDFKNMGIDSTSLKYLKPETAKEISKYIISKNDLYISIAGSIGKVGLIPEYLDNAHLTENAGKLCEIKMNKKFLCYLLNSEYCQQQISSFIKSTSQPKLALFRIKEILIPVAPLNEQKRIVEKIEELFSILDFSKEVMEKTKILLKQNKQSFLKSSLEGNLTEIWRKKNNIEKNMTKANLDDLIMFSKNGLTGRPNDIGNGTSRLGIETVTGTNSIYVDESKCKFVDISTSELMTYEAIEDDLFVCRQNGNKNYVGKCAVFKKNLKPTIFSDSLIQLRINQKIILSAYLAYFLNSTFGRSQIEQFCSTTAGNFSINATNLKKTIVSFPTINEQKIIIEKIENGFSLIENTEKIINSSLRNYNIMKKIILNKAFEGKLITQDPDDESINMFIQKLKQEKEQLIQKQKASRRKKNVK